MAADEPGDPLGERVVEGGDRAAGQPTVEIVGQGRRRGGAPGGGLLQTPQADPVEWRRNVPIPVARRERVALEDVEEGVDR